MRRNERDYSDIPMNALFAPKKMKLAKLPQKNLNSLEKESSVDFDNTSIFHDISEIERVKTGSPSYELDLHFRDQIEQILKGTDKISDLIVDEKTTLVSKEIELEPTQSDIFDRRFIIYQREGSTGQLKIKAKEQDDFRTEADENEPFRFSQCTFYFCDTSEKQSQEETGLWRIGIRICTEQKVKFTDCAFIGVNFSPAGIPIQVSDFVVFTDSFSKINLELEACYFKNLKAVIFTNFSVRGFKAKGCTFDHIEADGIHIKQPYKCSIKRCHFIGSSSAHTISMNPINIKLFEDETVSLEKTNKRTSLFATSLKIDQSLVIHDV